MVVPVIDKTPSVFNSERTEQQPRFKELYESDAPRKFTVKMDGTCGAVIRLPTGEILLCRRQDIKPRVPNYQFVHDNGKLETIAGRPCFVSQMNRQGKKKVIHQVPIYIFMLEDGKPEARAGHLIGFTPVNPEIPDDAFCCTVREGNSVWVADRLQDRQISVVRRSLEDLLGDQDLLTVELMGEKIASRYTFSEPKCCLFPHGSIEFSTPPPLGSVDEIRKWFETSEEANVEGVVVHFPEERFKVHVGHAGLENVWRSKKASGFSFVWEN